MKVKNLISIFIFLCSLSVVNAAINESDIIACYPMDTTCGYNRINDSESGTPVNTPFINTTYYKLGTGSCQFTRTSSEYVNIDNLVTKLSNINKTIELWVKVIDAAATQGMVSFSKATYSEKSQYLSTNKLQASADDITTYENKVLSGGTYNDGLWHHMVYSVTYQGKFNYFYVDGVNLGRDITNVLSTTSLLKGVIGAAHSGSAYVNYLNGYIDEVKIFNRNLTDAEVLSLYNSGTGVKCIDYLGCEESLMNLSRQNISCLTTNVMNQSYITYDANSCGTYENTTFYIATEYCDYQNLAQIYPKLLEIEEKIDNMEGDFEMIGIVLLYGLILSAAVFVYRTQTLMAFIALVALTGIFDLYLLTLTEGLLDTVLWLFLFLKAASMFTVGKWGRKITSG